MVPLSGVKQPKLKLQQGIDAFSVVGSPLAFARVGSTLPLAMLADRTGDPDRLGKDYLPSLPSAPGTITFKVQLILAPKYFFSRLQAVPGNMVIVYLQIFLIYK